MIIDRKKIKKASHKSLRKTYLKSILVIFIFTIVMGGGYTFTSRISSNSNTTYTESKSNFQTIDELINEEIKKQGKEDKIDKKKAEKARGVLAPVINKVTHDKSALISFLNSFKLFYYKHNISAGLMSLLAGIILMLIYIFIKLVLDIGKIRYYLEARRYEGTKIEKLLFPYRTKRTIHLALIIFTRNIYQFLWNLTIVGGIIKHYEYLMIPYVLAENPNLTHKEAYNLSKEMMKGLKWQTFKLDVSLIGWEILSIFTLGFSNLLYTDAYKEFIYAEMYMTIRDNKKDTLTYSKLLNDKYLDIKTSTKKEYPIDKYHIKLWYKKDFKSDYNQKYPLTSLILFFFTFSFIGWIWEVMLHLVTEGAFVNRGTMFGPWLPIYGFGGLLILIVLKPFRKKPVIYFLVSMILAGVLEYSTAWYLETFKGMKWWDYSGYFLNLHGRICLEGLIVFGLGGAVVTYFIGPLLNYYYTKIKPQIAITICTILILLFSIDAIYSSKHPNAGKGITSYSQSIMQYVI